MSPKDLKTIDFLNKILKAGVQVLKIEGRGRSADYVKTVTRVYRQAVDAYFEGKFTTENLENWNRLLASVYNRGFWDGYYLGKKMGEWTEQYGSLATKRKEYIGKVTNYFSKIGVAEIVLETKEIKVGDEYQINGPTTGVIEGEVAELRVDEKSVERAVKGNLLSMPVAGQVRKMDKVFRVFDAEDEF